MLSGGMWNYIPCKLPVGDYFVQLLLFLQGKCNYYLPVIFDTSGGLIVEPLLFTSVTSETGLG